MTTQRQRPSPQCDRSSSRHCPQLQPPRGHNTPQFAELLMSCLIPSSQCPEGWAWNRLLYPLCTEEDPEARQCLGTLPPPDTPLPQTWPPLPGSPLCWAGYSGHSVCPEPALPFTSPNFLPSPLSQFSISQQEEFHEIHQKTPGAVPSTQWALQERGMPPSQVFSLHSFSSQEVG